MEYKDYYETMGVAREATQDEIKRAYRKLARKYHPDVSEHEEAEARFKEVGEAYEVLKDTEKRTAYDRFGADWKSGQDFHPPPGWDEEFEFRGPGAESTGGQGYGGYGGGQYSDFFENLFRRGQAGSADTGRGEFHMHGEDRHAHVSVDLRDSYNGAQRSMTLRVPEITEDGRVLLKEKTLNVKIPRGIREGQKIRLAGQGGAGIGEGKAGDLFLEVEFSPDDVYRVDGIDVYMNLPVTPWEAALGASVTAPTPSGKLVLKVPAGSNQGSKLRLKGKGIPAKTPGDLYVVLNVRLPPAEGEEAKAVYEKMSKEMPFNPRADL